MQEHTSHYHASNLLRSLTELLRNLTFPLLMVKTPP